MPSTLLLIPLLILASFGIMLIILPHGIRKKETLVLFGTYFILKAILGVVFIYSIPDTIPALEYTRAFVLYFSFTVLYIAVLSLPADARKLFKRYYLIYIIGLIPGFLYLFAVLFAGPGHILTTIALVLLAAAVMWQILAFQIAIISIHGRFLRYVKENYSYIPKEEMAVIHEFTYLEAFVIASFFADLMIVFFHHTWVQIAYVVFQLVFGYGVSYIVTGYRPSRMESVDKFWAFWEDTDPERFEYFSADATDETPEPITEEKHDELLRKLIVYFIEEKPFLSKKLVMSDVAKALNTNRTYISQIINSDLGTTFFNFVNVFRIEEAKKQMSSNSAYSMKTIADISGFSSYTTFSKYHRMYGTKPARWYKQIS